jgi:transposase
MITIGGRARIFLATGVADLRRGFGLQAVIEHDLGCPPLNGDVYLFANRRRDMIKAFFFDCGGTWVCAKRLMVGTFRWPERGEAKLELTAAELQLLLSGLDLTTTRARRWWTPAASNATATARIGPSPGDPATGR